MVAMVCGVVGIASLATAYDAARASYTIQLWAMPVILVSVCALVPYMGSIVAQANRARFPLLGVRTAHWGVLGLCAAVGLAIALPKPVPVEVAIALVGVAVVLVAVERLRARQPRDIRER
jgi:hypothetical protein